MLLRMFLIMMLPLISYGQTEADEKKENRFPPAVTEEVTPPESESVTSSVEMISAPAGSSEKPILLSSGKETLDPLQVKERIRVNANVNFPQDI